MWAQEPGEECGRDRRRREDAEDGKKREEFEDEGEMCVERRRQRVVAATCWLYRRGRKRCVIAETNSPLPICEKVSGVKYRSVAVPQRRNPVVLILRVARSFEVALAYLSTEVMEVVTPKQ